MNLIRRAVYLFNSDKLVLTFYASPKRIQKYNIANGSEAMPTPGGRPFSHRFEISHL